VIRAPRFLFKINYLRISKAGLHLPVHALAEA
jgi:hypothetical protein